MNCPNCGADLPDGSTYCSICATPIQGNQPNAGGAMYSQSGASAVPTKKSSPVGIIIGVVAALVVVFLLGYFVLGGKYNGTYMLDTMSMEGMTFSASDLAVFGMSDVGIKVSFGRCSFVGGDSLGLGDSGKSKIKFTSDSVTITDSDGTTATGSFDGKSFTIESSGVEMTFTKE